ncbi:TPA: hypothetical protein QB189_000584 [Pasteurella multocida]|nr:hypothetical protein [Pasteurella multocida]
MKYIEKTIEDSQTGANASYHELVSFTVDYNNSSVTSTTASYVSKKAKDGNKKALSFNSFYLNSVPERGESSHDWVLNQLVQPQPEDYQHDGQSVNPYMFAGGQVKND